MIETTLERGVGLRIRPWLGIAAAASFVVASFMALIWAPADAVQGEVYRIIYVHVPSAWLAYLAFVVVFVMYVGYLLLRGLSTDFQRRATRAAILGVILVIDVPIVHLSVLWANSLHQLPTVLRAAGGPALDSSMLLTLMVSVAAFTLVYAYFMSARVAIELVRQERLWIRT